MLSNVVTMNRYKLKRAIHAAWFVVKLELFPSQRGQAGARSIARCHRRDEDLAPGDTVRIMQIGFV